MGHLSPALESPADQKPIEVQPIVERPPVRVVQAEVVDPLGPERLPPTWPFRLARFFGSAAEWLFGVATLVFGLAFLATIPVLQFASLGYLLEVTGRVARSGRLRDGFVGVRKAARVGGAVLGTLIVYSPLLLISSLWYDAQLIDPSSRVSLAWRVGLATAIVVAVLHAATALYCGGRLRHFFWPLFVVPVVGLRLVQWFSRTILKQTSQQPTFVNRLLADISRERPVNEWWFVPAILWRYSQEGRWYARARDSLWDFVTGLRPRYYLSLGARGFVGTLLILFVPILTLIGSTKLDQGPAATLAGLAGGLLFATVLLYLPFLQVNFAVENRFAALFDIGAVRMFFRRAPIAFWFALFITLLFALPLYLLKIELVPREVAWLPSLAFVAFIWPARLLTGWAVGRGRKRDRPRFFLFRWMSRFAAIPVVLFYVLICYFTQFISWNGAFNLFEQHAFLVPVSFLGG